MSAPDFLPGVPVDHVLRRLGEAAGDELASGKFASLESSAALAVNCFGWFIPQPERLPVLPGLEAVGRPRLVGVEFCARFPWSGGRHPWLDAVVQTDTHLIGIESKRFEPFRDRKKVSLSAAYDRDVWGSDMKRYEQMRDALRASGQAFALLDAVQLVKHAFGLVTTARRRGLEPALFYVYAEPHERDGRPISPEAHQQHRAEIEVFARAVTGDKVRFASASYCDWLASWNGSDDELAAHRDAILGRFAP